MQDKVRVGMVGTSWYSDISHLNLLKSHPGAVTAAICGRNRVRAEEMALKYAIPTVYTDYRDMIQHGHLDAVVIATPDDMHYPMVMAALDAGLHVLVKNHWRLTWHKQGRCWQRPSLQGSSTWCALQTGGCRSIAICSDWWRKTISARSITPVLTLQPITPAMRAITGNGIVSMAWELWATLDRT